MLLVPLASLATSGAQWGYSVCGCATTPDILDSVNSANYDMSTYGIGCAAHDSNANGECGIPGGHSSPVDCALLGSIVPTPRDYVRAGCGARSANMRLDTTWCEKRWCYVADPKACKEAASHRLALEHSVYFPNSTRYYSYATCGDLDVFVRSLPTNRLSGRILRVGVLFNSGGWMGSYHTQGVHHTRDEDTGGWRGPIWDFVRSVESTANFTINITEPDAWIQERADDWSLDRVAGTGAFEHCAYATALGHLDFCIGQSSIDPGRFDVTNWFVYQYNPLYLIAPKVPRNQPPSDGLSAWFYGRVSAIFKPLDWWVWALIFFLVVPLSSLLMTWQEALEGMKPQGQEQLHGEKPQDKKSPRSSSLLRQLTSLPPKKDHPDLPAFHQHFISNFFSSLRSLFAMDIGLSRSQPALVTQLGLGFFLLLIVASYTANLANVLITREQVGSISSWNGIRPDHRLCGTRKGAESARLAYPPIALGGSYNWIMDSDGEYGMKSQDAVWDLVRGRWPNGTATEGCDYVVADYMDLLLKQSLDSWYCNMIRVGEPIAHEPVGMAMTSVGETAHLLSEAFAAEMATHRWEIIKREQTPISRCSARDDDTTMYATDLMGAFLIVLIFWLIGCGCSIWSSCRSRRPRPRSQQPTRKREGAAAGGDADGGGGMGGGSGEKQAPADKVKPPDRPPAIHLSPIHITFLPN